ncbi:MAG: hypothetical protein KJ624_00020 [Chloroflexi bacterium]|nr:hypothetical protein [Chloroflexota bacterium]
MTEDAGKQLHNLIVALDGLKAEVKGSRVEADARKLEIVGLNHVLRRLEAAHQGLVSSLGQDLETLKTRLEVLEVLGKKPWWRRW